MPVPEPTMDDAAFWASCAEKVLRFQACKACGALRHPPTPVCAACGSNAVVLREAPTRGRIYSYTVVHHAAHPTVASSLPYVVAVIEFPGLPGVRFISNVTDIEPRELAIGVEVELWWD